MRKLIWLAIGLVLAVGHAWAEPAAGTVWIEPKTGMEFVWLSGGCFEMGGGETASLPVHKTCLKGFWMGKYEVTQDQYQRMMGNNPSHFGGLTRPVEHVNWDDATSFVGEMSRQTGAKVRLPSEAEWEYACRAGGAHKEFCGKGGIPERMAWHGNNSGQQTHPVGELTPNDWGLYDMSGNVWEWTQDCWNANYKNAPVEGGAWKSGNCGRRVLRGGSWRSIPSLLRAAIRINSFDVVVTAIQGNFDVGFRVAMARGGAMGR